MIPLMHQSILSSVVKAIGFGKSVSRDTTKLLLYDQLGWTFHAKGLWIYPESNRFETESSCLPNMIFILVITFFCQHYIFTSEVCIHT
jgi:hypothetical protein